MSDSQDLVKGDVAYNEDGDLGLIFGIDLRWNPPVWFGVNLSNLSRSPCEDWESSSPVPATVDDIGPTLQQWKEKNR